MKKLFFLCSFLVFASLANAKTIYAIPNGISNWTTPGAGSMALPYNLQYGLWATALGDTLLLKGTFARTTQIYIEKTDLTIGSWGTGAVIQGSSDTSTVGFNLMVLKNCSNLTIENISFTQNYGNGSRGIYAWGKGNNITIKNCSFSYIGWSTDPLAVAPAGEGAHAILILGNKNDGSYTNINILGNTVNNCITGWSESITIIGNVDGFLIADNTVTDVSNIGIDVAGHFSWVKDWDTNIPLNPALNQARNGRIKNNTVTNAVSPVATSAGIYCDGCRAVVIERNIVTACGAGISIGCEVGGGNTASEVTVMNNIFQENIQSGMFLGSSLSEGAAQGPSSVDNCVIKNNTFYKNGDGNPVNNYEVFLQNSKNNQFFNNILYIGNNARGIVSASGGPVVQNFTMDYNLFYRANGSTDDFVISAGSTLTGNIHSQVGDPGFTGEKNIDPNSRAANAGDPSTAILAGELDRDGGVRKISSTVDIGAQESNSTKTAPIPNFKAMGEVGKVTIAQSSASQWHTITLNNTYTSPVVVFSPLSYGSSDPATVRVKNVTANSFQYQIDEWDYLDGAHSSETFFYIVVEAGHYQLDNGVILQANTSQIGTSWTSVNFPSGFNEDPLVFAQTVSYNDNSAVTTRMRYIDGNGFNLKIQEEEANDNVHSNETVAWIAITEGDGDIGLAFEVDGTSINYDHIFYEMYFNNTYVDPILFANMITTEGNDPAALRYRFLESDVVEMKVQEECSADNETGHTNEAIGFMVFEGTGDIFGVPIISSRVVDNSVENPFVKITSDALNLKVYPNPFYEQLNINYDLKKEGNIQINIYGVDGKNYYHLNEFQSKGFQKITLAANQLPKQILFVELIADGQKTTRKLMAK